jgi:hypothetical protein
MRISIIIFFLWSTVCLVNGQYKGSAHRAPISGEIPVTAPGSYDIAGATYLLMNDIRSEKSAIFLGRDVVLDLNGYSVIYADGNYGHIRNGSFEEGLVGWDVSKAPGAHTADRKVHVFIGDSILSLKKGEEIVSDFINLPLAGRSYFAFCGVTRMDMRISVYVEDKDGKSITCNTQYGDKVMTSCPVINKAPMLGGGFVYAHLNGLPAGDYRIRIKAETDCLIDYADIRPAMDTGIGIVGHTDPMGHVDHLYERVHSAFFDYTSDSKKREPVAGLPEVHGKGTVVIRNGEIRNAGPGILSWGIQSTADSVFVVLDNVKISTQGINSTNVDVPQAVITNCSFDADNPFIINRHGSEFYAVDLRGELPSEVSFSEFHGGQGCLVFKGNYSKVHHNFFANRQTVTNHYSIMAMGDSSLIYNNIVVPEIGSGIEVYVHRGMEIFNNTIKIVAAPPTCEYGHEEYSTTAVRIADYNARPGSPGGCFGNKLYNNNIEVISKDYPEFTDYVPMAWALFYSSSAGDNYIFGNKITVRDLTPGLKNEATAFYIGGGAIGGQFYGNTITANVPAFWVASRYGSASTTKIFSNRIIKDDQAGAGFKAVRIGWDQNVATGIEFTSNDTEGALFDIDATAKDHTWSVSWKMKIKLLLKNGKPAAGRELSISDSSGKIVSRLVTADDGSAALVLPEYTNTGGTKNSLSPYTIAAGKVKKTVVLNKDLSVDFTVK